MVAHICPSNVYQISCQRQIKGEIQTAIKPTSTKQNAKNKTNEFDIDY